MASLLGSRARSHAPRWLALASLASLASLVWTTWIVLPATLAAQSAATPGGTSEVPACRGVDPAAAAAAIEAGDAAVARATQLASRGRAAPAQAAFAQALASYDAACAAGAELALERRAIPLTRLGRALEAIESLDAFLASHPLASLPEADRARIESNRRSLERQVVSLSVSSRPDATVLVDGHEIGHTPLAQHRLAAGGEIELTVRAPGHLDAVQRLALEPGVAQRIAVELTPIAATDTHESATVSVAEPSGIEPRAVAEDVRGVDRASSGELERSAEASRVIDRSASEPRPSSGAADRTPWIVVTSVVAAVGLGTGIGGLVLMNDRRNAMDGSCFGLVPDVIPGCSTIRSEYDVGMGLAIGGFALAAVAGTAAVVLAVLPADDDPESASLTCGVGPRGLDCRGRF